MKSLLVNFSNWTLSHNMNSNSNLSKSFVKMNTRETKVDQLENRKLLKKSEENAYVVKRKLPTV